MATLLSRVRQHICSSLQKRRDLQTIPSVKINLPLVISFADRSRHPSSIIPPFTKMKRVPSLPPTVTHKLFSSHVSRYIYAYIAFSKTELMTMTAPTIVIAATMSAVTMSAAHAKRAEASWQQISMSVWHVYGMVSHAYFWTGRHSKVRIFPTFSGLIWSMYICILSSKRALILGFKLLRPGKTNSDGRVGCNFSMILFKQVKCVTIF